MILPIFIILPILLVVLILIFYIIKKTKKETFTGGLRYVGQDFAYNQNPRDQTYKYINYKDSFIYVPDPFTMVNKSLYTVLDQ